MFGRMTTKIKKTLVKNTCISSYATQAEYYNILIKYLKLDPFTAKSVVQKRVKLLHSVTKHHIVQNCLLCLDNDVEFNNLEMLTRMLLMQHSNLENRIHLLKDMGVTNVCNNKIHNLTYHIRQPAEQFKKEFNIPPDQNLPLGILEKLDKMPRDTRIFENLSDKLPMTNHYSLLMEYFKTHVLPPKYKDCILYNEGTRNKFRSFSLILDTISFLERKMGFTPAFIKDHLYLMNISLRNVHMVLEDLKDVTIDGLSFNEFVLKWPRILCCNANNVKELLQLFKEHDIPDGSILKCPSIFLIDASVFVQRLTRIQNVPQLQSWLSNSYVLHFIVHPRLMANRFETFMKWNLQRYMSEDILVTCTSVLDKGSVGKKLMGRMLRAMFPDDRQQRISKVRLHPRWVSLSIFELQSTAEYLRQYYSTEDIYNNIQILLYPRDVVAKAREFVHGEYAPLTGHNFTSSQYLAICVYVLEKCSGCTAELEGSGETQRGRFDNKEIDIDKLKRIVDDNARKTLWLSSDVNGTNEGPLSEQTPVGKNGNTMDFIDDKLGNVESKIL